MTRHLLKTTREMSLGGFVLQSGRQAWSGSLAASWELIFCAPRSLDVAAVAANSSGAGPLSPDPPILTFPKQPGPFQERVGGHSEGPGTGWGVSVGEWHTLGTWRASGGSAPCSSVACAAPGWLLSLGNLLPGPPTAACDRSWPARVQRGLRFINESLHFGAKQEFWLRGQQAQGMARMAPGFLESLCNAGDVGACLLSRGITCVLGWRSSPRAAKGRCRDGHSQGQVLVCWLLCSLGAA